MLDASVFRNYFDLFARRLVCAGYLVTHELLRHRHAKTGQTLAELTHVVPAVDVVDHVEERQETSLAAVTVQEGRAALDQLVIDALVLVACAGDHERERLRACACAGDHDLVLLQTASTWPATALVADRQLRVVAVGLLLVEGDFLDAGVLLVNIQVILPRTHPAGECRFLGYRELKSAVHQIRLVELGRDAVDFRAELALAEDHIFHDPRRQECLTALAPHDHQHLAVVARAVRVHQTEDSLDRRLLPQRQPQPVRCECALVVVRESLNKSDRLGRLLCVECVLAFRDVRLQPVVELPDPLACRYLAGAYRGVIFAQGAHLAVRNSVRSSTTGASSMIMSFSLLITD